jgi:hypothetical protein
MRADWADHPDIGVDELAVLAILSLYASGEGRCWPSQTTIADRLGKSRSWVNRVLGRLHALAIVGRERREAERGRHATRLYTLVGHAEALATAFGPGVSRDGHVAGRVAEGQHEQQPSAESGISPEGRDTLGQGDSPDFGQGEPTLPTTDWRPTAEDRACAQAVGVDPDQFAALFVASCHACGYRYRDHSAAYRTWLINCWEKPHDHHRPDRRRRTGREPPGSVDSDAGDRSAANRHAALAALHILAG